MRKSRNSNESQKKQATKRDGNSKDCQEKGGGTLKKIFVGQKTRGGRPRKQGEINKCSWGRRPKRKNEEKNSKTKKIVQKKTSVGKKDTLPKQGGNWSGPPLGEG